MDTFDHSTTGKGGGITDELLDDLAAAVAILPNPRQRQLLDDLCNRLGRWAGGNTMIDDELRKAIATSGRTCYALAAAAGIRPEVLTRFMNGERDLRLATAAKVADVLRVSLRGPTTRKAAR